MTTLANGPGTLRAAVKVAGAVGLCFDRGQQAGLLTHTSPSCDGQRRGRAATKWRLRANPLSPDRSTILGWLEYPPSRPRYECPRRELNLQIRRVVPRLYRLDLRGEAGRRHSLNLSTGRHHPWRGVRRDDDRCVCTRSDRRGARPHDLAVAPRCGVHRAHIGHQHSLRPGLSAQISSTPAPNH
jgi:hypothetical protein